MITYKITETAAELAQILDLQAKNLPNQLTETDKEEQGFVTVHHDLDILQKMHDIHPHIIAVSDQDLAGYALSMSAKFREDIPVLVPMFTEIDASEKGASKYIIMGQVCVDKNFRGKGIFRGLYAKMKEEFSGVYDCIITEIDTLNTRSLNAHSAIGFKELLRYESGGQTWVVVYMDI